MQTLQVMDNQGRRGIVEVEVNNVDKLSEWSIRIEGRKREGGNTQGKKSLVHWLEEEELTVIE